MPPRSEKNWNQKAASERRGDGNHFNQLYDENEDMAGQKIDEATGKPINNSPEVSGNDEILREIEPQAVLSDSREGEEISEQERAAREDVLGKLPEEDDEAARWLSKNDRQHSG